MSPETNASVSGRSARWRATRPGTGRIRPAHLVALGVEASLEHVPAAVLVPTRSGATARGIARFRLPVWTVAVSARESTCRRLQFSAGVLPMHETDRPERWDGYARGLVGELGLAGDLVILMCGWSTGFFLRSSARS